MGVDTNLSVGPYMVVKGVKEVTRTEKVLTCSNIDCEVNIKNKNRKGDNNCNKCGSPITKKSYNVVEKIKAKDYFWGVEEFEDELCYTDPMCGESNIYVPNDLSPFSKKNKSNDNDESIDLTDVNIQEEIDWFKEKYKKIIDYITAEFGEDSVSIRYGAIQWYS
jgi:hypothetical protein